MRNLELKIEESKIQKEFEIIKQGKPNGYSTLSQWNEIVLYFQWKEFYKKELEIWEENRFKNGLPLQSWIYLNRKKYIGKDATTLTDREILRAFKITGIHIGNSFHSPFYIQQFIKDYNINSVYDCAGGWGHRLLGAYNIKYIYNDINPITYKNCIEISNYFNLTDKVFYNKDSSVFTPHENYEAVFTCPPYFNIEKYSKYGAENLPYQDFLIWWKQTIQASFLDKPSCKYFAFIINQSLKNDMEACCLAKYLKKIEEIPLGKENYSHLNANKRNKGNKKEILLIFTKQC